MKMWCWFIIVLVQVGNHASNGQQSLTDIIEQEVRDAANDTPDVDISRRLDNFAPGARIRPVSRQPGRAAPRASTRLANLFNGQRPRTAAIRRSARGGIIAEKTLSNLQNRTFRGKPLALNDVKGPVAIAVEPFCGYKPVLCDNYSPYRTPDGTCNNLFRVRMGSADTPQPRFIDPEYGDPWNWGFVPRIRGKNGQKLTNPRDISNAVFKSDTSSPQNDQYNVALTHFGQFIDHDVVKTPIFTESNGEDLECCDGNLPVVRPECFPFNTKPGEFKHTCMNFVRSRPACFTGRRQQVNLITSWLDLSNVYGSSKEEQHNLRTSSGGLMKVGVNDLLPDDIGTCAHNIKCFKAGDTRNSEIPLLTLMHTIFVREHNRIAGKLSGKGWSDEKTFQETRKILTAVYQHIAFNEFLPAVLGFSWARSVGLISEPSGLINLYSSHIDGSTRNEFGASAFRMGHSLVGSLVGAADSSFHEVINSELKEEFFDTKTIRDVNDEFGVKRIGRWMSSTFCQKMDRFFTNQLRNHLFEGDPGDALDLGALNIQRGRDHGLPGYNKFREFCGLFPAAFFSNLQGGFVDHSSDTVAKLATLYTHVDDVDLYVGAISERPTSPDTILGPTFRCMIALQFLHYKYADRFFYENNLPTTGFNIVQVNDIKRQTLAGIYCRTLSIHSIQPNIFQNPGSSSDRVVCDNLPDLDFTLY